LNSNILEFENILIKCQYLDRLVIVGPFVCDWKRFFEILARSSPTSLFKFKFKRVSFFIKQHLKSFFENWKGRHPNHPMVLHLINETHKLINVNYKDLIIEYKAKGIIKEYRYYTDFGMDFEWDLK
jgi:hypothetical protein